MNYYIVEMSLVVSLVKITEKELISYLEMAVYCPMSGLIEYLILKIKLNLLIKKTVF